MFAVLACDWSVGVLALRIIRKSASPHTNSKQVSVLLVASAKLELTLKWFTLKSMI